jgi:hypothetical protein
MGSGLSVLILEINSFIFDVICCILFFYIIVFVNLKSEKFNIYLTKNNKK